MNRALQHLSYPRPTKKPILLLETLTLTSDGCLVKGEISSGESAFDQILEEVPSSHVAFAIRIEDDCKTTATPPQWATIAHNLGIACYGVSRSLRKSNKIGQRFGDASVHLAHSATGQLLNHLAALEHASMAPTYQQGQTQYQADMHALLLAALNTLFHLQQEFSMTTDADESYGMLVHIRNEALDLQQQAQEDISYLLRRQVRSGGSAPAA